MVAATFACPGPTAIHACSLAEQAGVVFEGMNTAVVQGLGPLGSFAVMCLKKAGIQKVYAITAGDNPERETLALELRQSVCLTWTGRGWRPSRLRSGPS